MTGEGGTRVVGTNPARDGKPGKLETAITKLHEARGLLPIAETMVEGLQGSVEKSNAYTDEKVRPLKADVSGVNERMKDMTARSERIEATANEIKETVKEKAAEIDRAAKEASNSAQSASSVAEAARQEAERAAEAAMSAKQSLADLAARDERAPQIAVAALEGVVRATVSDVDQSGKDKKVEKKGADLIQHMVNGLETLKAAVGRSTEEAEECRGLLEQARTLISEQRQADEETAAQNKATISALDEAVTKAEGAAERTASAAAEIKQAFEAVSEGVEYLKMQMSVVAAVLLGKAKASDSDTKAVLESAMETEEGE